MVVCIKNNLAPLPKSLAFEIDDQRFYWKGESEITADEMLAPKMAPGDYTERDEVKQFLFSLLFDKGPMPAKEVFKEITEAGYAISTARRAAKELGIKPFKEGFEGSKWMWALPRGDKAIEDAKMTNTSMDEGWSSSEEKTETDTPLTKIFNASKQNE